MGMTGFDLNKALTDIDERYWDETDSRKPTARMENVKTRKGGKKRTVRIVLLAACMVTLLAGSVAAANKARNNDNTFLALMGTTSATEEFDGAYVPIGIVSKGDVTVTLENIIGDTNTIFCEFSTDYELENCQEGWIWNQNVYPDVRVTNISGKAFFEDEDCAGKGSVMSAFCRDGKLWFMYQISYSDPDLDLSHKRMKVTMTTRRLSTKTVEEHAFEWTNDYKTVSEVITLNAPFEDFTLNSIAFSLTRMQITATFPNRSSWDYPTIKVDYFILDDGTYLFYNKNLRDAFKLGGGGIRVDEYGNCVNCTTFDLIGEFAEENSNVGTLVNFSKIATISINGREIDIR